MEEKAWEKGKEGADEPPARSGDAGTCRRGSETAYGLLIAAAVGNFEEGNEVMASWELGYWLGK